MTEVAQERISPYFQIEPSDVEGMHQVVYTFECSGSEPRILFSGSLEQAQEWAIKQTKIDELKSEFSDYFKAIHNIRPCFGSDENWANEEWLKGQIAELDRHLNHVKNTPELRAEYEAQGWRFKD